MCFVVFCLLFHERPPREVRGGAIRRAAASGTRAQLGSKRKWLSMSCFASTVWLLLDLSESRGAGQKDLGSLVGM